MEDGRTVAHDGRSNVDRGFGGGVEVAFTVITCSICNYKFPSLSFPQIYTNLPHFIVKLALRKPRVMAKN